jgi:hypothetical protein
MLMTLGLLVTGCCSPSTIPSEKLNLPKLPALSEPLPSVTYSKQSQLSDEASRKKLTDMSTTFKLVEKDGLNK